MPEEHTFRTHIGANEIVVATGKLAEQAGGSVTIRMGDSLVLGTATMSRNPREGMNFFPLMVDFEERIYAAGRIPGSFFRREGRPSTESILTARVTDRSLRPLFPEGMRHEVQIVITALSSDTIHHLDLMSLNAASAALTISNIPWNGPVGAVRVGYINGQLVANPTIPEMEDSRLDLRLAGTREAIIMVEAGAMEVPESLMVDALAFGHEAIQDFISLQEEMRATLGKPKAEIEYFLLDEGHEAAVGERVGDRLRDILAQHTDRDGRNEAVGALREEIMESFLAEDELADMAGLQMAFEKRLKKEVRARILDGVRPDGRDYTTVRELACEVGLSPRAHGSGLFRRGQTQVLSIVTLGTPREAQKLDGLTPQESRRFMHHYNFPPYSTGETWPMRGPRRREIGHGMLGLTAMEPVLPDEEEFPYTIRVVSEVLSSNGSTSQASICAGVLALMDCGVPLRRPVAGVAMGMVKEGDRVAVLTDIQGMEDHLGDMDFKVAGTSDGITALQMDIKIGGLSKARMAEALEQARQARMEILGVMTSLLPAPRAELSPWAPRMVTIKIDPEQIGAVIGKGGATIRSIQDAFDVAIDIQEDGTVFVAGVDGKKTDEAIERIQQIARGPEIGDTMLGKVVRITDFGAFIELLPGTDGMVHISQLATERVRSVDDVIQLGDELLVMITDVDPMGKIRLSRRAVLEGMTLEEARASDPALGRGSRERSSGGRGRRGNNDRRGGRRN